MRWKVRGFQPEYKFPILVLAYTLATIMFIITARIHLRQPATLAWTSADSAIPLLPWTIFVYFSHFPFLFFALLLLKDRENMNRVAVSMVLATLIGIACFVIYPTILPPRGPFHFRGSVGILFDLIYWIDTPYSNCFPSLHVAYSFLVALGYRDEQQQWYLPMMSWASLIALSTLTTKQHYFVDVPAGIILAWGCRKLVDRRLDFSFQEDRVAQ